MLGWLVLQSFPGNILLKIPKNPFSFLATVLFCQKTTEKQVG
jgi:hypothetical protein